MSFRSLILAACAAGIGVGQAAAADLYTPPPPEPVFQPEPSGLRSGFYIGANAGMMRGTYDVTVVTLPDPPYAGYGGTLGLHAGYDYYGDGYMVGIEADGALTTVHHDTMDSFGAKNSSDMLWMERGPDLTGRAPGNYSNVHWGWTLGAGAEFAVTDNILLRGEYLYMDLSEERYRVARGLPPIDNTYSGHMIRTALSYKFD